MHYTQNELAYHDYNWGFRYSQRDPLVSGEISGATFNRTEGPQMLYFLNACARKWQWTEKERRKIRDLEKVIRQIVPDSLAMQMEVEEWLRHYFNLPPVKIRLHATSGPM